MKLASAVFILGLNATISVTNADFNGLRRVTRSRNSKTGCAALTDKRTCHPAPGCTWKQGTCFPLVVPASAPSPPFVDTTTANADDKEDFTITSGDEPTTTTGAGFCSDDPGRPCDDISECVCGVAGKGGRGKGSLEWNPKGKSNKGNIFGRRELKRKPDDDQCECLGLDQSASNLGMDQAQDASILSIPLELAGNDCRADAGFTWPLGECQGDCDLDTDCQGSLTCFQRSGNEPVPGCSGTGTSGKDYCYAGAACDGDCLEDFADESENCNGNVPTLGKCQGDCDDDDDCEGVLECFQRGEFEPVPGCTGTGTGGRDYCYDPNPPTPSPTPCPDMEIVVNIVTDNYPEETSWILTNNCDGSEITPDEYVEKEFSHVQPYCLPLGEYTFVIEDTYGDGICCGFGRGSYEVTSNGVSVARGGEFDGTEASTFGSCSATSGPTALPTKGPTAGPSKAPSQGPTASPTKGPTAGPSKAPSQGPTTSPTKGPTAGPSKAPSQGPTTNPSKSPSQGPSPSPTAKAPITSEPTTNPTKSPSQGPTLSPTTKAPVAGTLEPTKSPTQFPTYVPTTSPTMEPTKSPTQFPTDAPTTSPTMEPTKSPTQFPTDALTTSPTMEPTKSPTQFPTDVPTTSPTKAPVIATPDPTTSPSKTPSTPPTAAFPPLVYVGDNGSPGDGTFPLGKCQGDCDDDDDCESPLKCFQRGGTQSVPGCTGTGISGKDYCYDPNPPTPSPTPCPDMEIVVNIVTDNYPEETSWILTNNCDGSEITPDEYVEKEFSHVQPYCLPLGEYTFVIEDTYGDGICCGFGRGSYEVTSNGVSVARGGEFDGTEASTFGSCSTTSPTKSPVVATLEPTVSAAPIASTKSPTPTGSPLSITAAPTEITYRPGDLKVPCDGGKLLLSTGLDCKRLTTYDERVQLANGSRSSEKFHEDADGAAVIPHPTDGGWYYTSNSESSNGGVGTLRFASNGDVIGYDRTLRGTIDNCGGGRTPWNTWVSCEENDSDGYCHEVDPYTKFTQRVQVVARGGNYESFAYDDQDPSAPNGYRFFITEDSFDGALTRYTPDDSAYTGNNYDILNTANGVYEYLVLNERQGTFTWSTSYSAGKTSASDFFRNSEGIDVHDRILSFTAKAEKLLYTLDLEQQTYIVTSTVSGAFDLQPDQIGRILGEADVLYFCEDGGSNCDIHGRDGTGKYFTIVEGTGYDSETTGLAFSPDGMFMYVAIQSNSHIYSFWRTDGMAFNGTVAETKYH